MKYAVTETRTKRAIWIFQGRSILFGAKPFQRIYFYFFPSSAEKASGNKVLETDGRFAVQSPIFFHRRKLDQAAEADF